MTKKLKPIHKNTNLPRRLTNFVYRTQVELAVSFIAAAMLLLAQYGARIVDMFDASDNTNALLTQTAGQFIGDKLAQLSSVPYANTVALVIFWTIAAILLYLSFLFISNVAITLKNEIMLESQNYTVKSHRLAQHITFKIITLIGFYAFIALSFGLLIPHWISLFGLFVNAGLALSTLYYAVLGVIALSWNIYLLWTTGKLVFDYERTL